MIIRTQHAEHDYVNGAHWIHLCTKCKVDLAAIATTTATPDQPPDTPASRLPVAE